MTTRTAKRARNFVRSLVGAYATQPITVEPGDAPPRWEGEHHHYETKTGIRVCHPVAYRRAFGRPIYIASSLRLVVGADFLASAERAAETLHAMR